MKDEYKEFFETEEADQDSKSDAKVILFLVCLLYTSPSPRD